MKKILAHLFCLVTVYSMVVHSAFATMNYQVHIAVICEDGKKGQDLIDLLCSSKSEVVYPLDSKFTSEKNERKNFTVISDRSLDINYHVEFHYMNSGSLNHTILKKCSGAIILYDISDPALDSIVQSATFYPSDLEHLISSFDDVPLVRDVVDLQHDGRRSSCSITRFIDTLVSCCSGHNGWYNAICFATYNGDRLDPASYRKRHEKLNAFTCEMEKYYGVDNKWSRGHPDLSSDSVYRKTLYWIAGQANRSIDSGFVEGDYVLAGESVSQPYEPPLFV